MDRWDVLIIAAASYVAVVSLVRLMAVRRNQLVEQVREQIDQQRQLATQQKTNTANQEDADRGAA